MKVRPSDVVSGKFYLKLIEDYKKYDQRQKDLIERLRKRVDFLKWQVEDLRIELEEAEDMDTEALRKKLRNQRDVLRAYVATILKLKKEIEDLTCQNASLTMELKNLKEVCEVKESGIGEGSLERQPAEEVTLTDEQGD